MTEKASDPVDHPTHYTSHPSGVECIQVTEHMPFCVGNAVKYLWRVDDKGDPIENLRKARWYIDREIGRRLALAPPPPAVPVAPGIPVITDAVSFWTTKGGPR